MAILPGSILGMLGGGQLGRMFVSAARSMGYQVIVLDPDPHSPAGSLANEHIIAEFTDQQALQRIARDCAVVSTEFENIPAEALEFLAIKLPVHPSAAALSTTQNRIIEKQFVQSLDLDTPAFIAVESEQDLARIDAITYPAILKTATQGYDGKGQVVCDSAADAAKAFRSLNRPCVLEEKIDLAIEVSVVLGRSSRGETTCFPVAQNQHRNGILDVSRIPAAIDEDTDRRLKRAAQTIADGLDYCGVLAVEFFISTQGQLLVNEIAPRPHNSGHFTLDACYTSQFEQQVRMICDLPAGDPRAHSAVAMLNVLGDAWPDQSGQPDWHQVLAIKGAKLHLYGKQQPRPGRKMGHINFIAEDIESALHNLELGRSRLQ